MVRTSSTARCRKCSISRLIRSPRASRTPSFRAISLLLGISLKSFFHNHRSDGKRYLTAAFFETTQEQRREPGGDGKQPTVFLIPEKQRYSEFESPELFK